MTSLLTSIRDSRRRTKQQVLQTLGLVSGTEDSTFQAEHAEFKATVTGLRSLQSKMRVCLDSLKKFHDAQSVMCAELATFHRGSMALEGAMEFAHVLTELDVTMAAVERLYEEEVIAAVDLMLWQVPEIEERVRNRRKLLLDYNAHLRKYEASKNSLTETQNHVHHQSSSRSFMARSKTESEIAEDVATRKVRVDQSEAAVMETTQWLEQQFAELAEKHEKGTILEGPMQAMLACQKLVHSRGVEKLATISSKYINKSFVETLHRYEVDFANNGMITSSNSTSSTTGQSVPHHVRKSSLTDRLFGDSNTSGNDGLDSSSSGGIIPLNGNNNNNQIGGDLTVFGKDITVWGMTTPQIVMDCISYLETRGLEVEGLFRIPGSSDVVHDLRHRYDSGETGCVFTHPLCEPADVATLLKLYFRDLPNPLIPCEGYSVVLDAARHAQEEKSSETRAQIVCDATLTSLPNINLSVLSMLLTFLQRVARNSDQNKMTTANLATCFAPTILRAPQDTSPVRVLSDMQLAIYAMKVMIEEASRFPNTIVDDRRRR
jgi:hypothetical protein